MSLQLVAETVAGHHSSGVLHAGKGDLEVLEGVTTMTGYLLKTAARPLWGHPAAGETTMADVLTTTVRTVAHVVAQLTPGIPGIVGHRDAAEMTLEMQLHHEQHAVSAMTQERL